MQWESSPLWTAVSQSGVHPYTGSVEATSGEHRGVVFFEEGRVVHAEAGALTGESAFQEILRWPAASFAVNPLETAGRVTIQHNFSMADIESSPSGIASSTGTPALAAELPRAPLSDRIVTATEQIRLFPGVLSAVLTGKTGPVPGLGPNNPKEEQTLALGNLGARIGSALGLGRMVGGVAQGADHLVLLLSAGDHQLSILVRAGHSEAVQAKLRTLLNP